MRLLPLLLLGLAILQPTGAVFNFLSRYMTFLRTDAALDSELYTPLAIMLILGTVAAGQYGFLPIKSKEVVRKLRQLRYGLGHKKAAVPAYRYRYRRDVTEDTLDWLLQAAQMLEDVAFKFDAVQRKARAAGFSSS